jgi:Transposase DNA-binding/Transposase DDE domain
MNNDYKEFEKWSHEQWGQAKLGDPRRTVRAVKVGAALAAQPAASLPKQLPDWKDLKAGYRLFDQEDVTHAALSNPHWKMTREAALNSEEQVILFVQDKSDLDFSHHPATKGLGHVGKFGQGMLLQSSVAIVPLAQAPQILGLAAQKVWLRTHQKRKSRETRSERHKREQKESEVWAEILKEIGEGPAPESGRRFVSVGDRESDIFSYVRQAREHRWDVLLRVAQNRVMLTPQGEQAKLLAWARTLAAQTTKSVILRGRDGKPKREVELQLSWSTVRLCAPRFGVERGQEPIAGWVVRCWAEGEEDLEWVLFTTVPVQTIEDARQIVEWYESRWVVEEYHKCLKTGCAMEERQLETAARLQALLGFLAIVALRLLQLRAFSRTEPDRPAVEIVPELLVRVVKKRLNLKPAIEEMTILEFFRGVARLGGFIGRKSDRDPGWQTLWRGWEKLQDLSWGLETLPVT